MQGRVIIFDEASSAGKSKISILHQKLIAHVGDLNNKTILDYGCGREGMLELLLQRDDILKSITAVDSNEEMVRECNNRFADFIKLKTLFVLQSDDPVDLLGKKFDIIFCHNVLECVEQREIFVRNLFDLLSPNGILVLSHHDFDSAVYNSAFKDLTRNLIHCFADTKQDWQTCHDGQIGRKIPGIFIKAGMKHTLIETWRIVERSFQPGDYGFLMSNMITDECKYKFASEKIDSWKEDLKAKSQIGDYYFAIDVVVAKIINNQK
jgi:SAM-dependent methyltransferase